MESRLKGLEQREKNEKCCEEMKIMFFEQERMKQINWANSYESTEENKNKEKLLRIFPSLSLLCSRPVRATGAGIWGFVFLRVFYANRTSTFFPLPSLCGTLHLPEDKDGYSLDKEKHVCMCFRDRRKTCSSSPHILVTSLIPSQADLPCLTSRHHDCHSSPRQSSHTSNGGKGA